MTWASDPRTLLVALVVVVAGCAGCVAPPPEEALTVRGAPPLDADPRLFTVRVRSSTCEGIGVGSGFLLDPRTIITNRHVVEGAQEITVETWQGEELTVEVASRAGFADVAVVRLAAAVSGLRRPVAALAPADPGPGTPVRAFGYAEGGPLQVTSGRVESYVSDLRLESFGKVMRADVDIETGNSGGPVLDDDERVVGVVYAIELSSDLALIIPVSTLHRLLTDRAGLAPVEAC
jgi:S1-C subfamily serine protease